MYWSVARFSTFKLSPHPYTPVHLPRHADLRGGDLPIPAVLEPIGSGAACLVLLRSFRISPRLLASVGWVQLVAGRLSASATGPGGYHVTGYQAE